MIIKAGTVLVLAAPSVTGFITGSQALAWIVAAALVGVLLLALHWIGTKGSDARS
jgi:hypothetical protein